MTNQSKPKGGGKTEEKKLTFTVKFVTDRKPGVSIQCH